MAQAIWVHLFETDGRNFLRFTDFTNLFWDIRAIGSKAPNKLPLRVLDQQKWVAVFL